MRGLLLTMLVLANIATALLIVRDRHEHRQAFVALTRLEKARDTLNIEFGRLQLEQATWAE
ncbi:MAG TPA: cell division protein FtsL, partial [Thermomonas sp.]|nr:cell division protein FtsL [Thermomonas sp.]HRA56940.1 cell division protein FtsL [Thermomonas sp.]